MQLSDARVQNYRSIIDSGTVTFDPEITGIVGMTGSGKTSFLKMLEGASRGVWFEESELPRASDVLQDFRDGRKGADRIVQLTANFKVEEGDRRYLPERYRGVKTITIVRTFDGEIRVSADGDALDPGSTDDEVGRMHGLAGTLGDALARIAGEVRAERPAPEADLYEENIRGSLEEFKAANFLDENELGMAIEALRSAAYSAPLSPDDMGEIESILGEMASLGAEIKAKLVHDPAMQLYSRIPKPLYWDGVFELDDYIAIDAFISDPGQSRTFRSISTICGLTPSSMQRIRSANAAERDAYLARKSAILSSRLNGFWTQEKYEFGLSIDGDALRLRVSDKTTGATTLPSERSEGFKWWVAFFLDVSTFLVADSGRRIILLDNPATGLHDKGKDDVLRFIQTAAETDQLQIVYSTHERALINPWRTDRVRIADLTDKGTRIVTVPAKSDGGLLDTIMKNIGSPARYSLFGAPRMVSFEGASDTYIASAVNEYMSQSDGGPALDKDSYSINSFNGIGAAPRTCRLYRDLGLEFVLVVDSGDATEAMKSRLDKDCAFGDYFIELRQVLGRDADIEDMVDRDLYYEAFTRAYGPVRAGALPPIEEVDGNMRKKRFNNYKEWFAANGGGAFDKTLVAQQMFGVMMARGSGGPARAASLDRTRANFAKLFGLIEERYRSHGGAA